MVACTWYQNIMPPPAPESRMTTGLPWPMQNRLIRRAPSMGTRRCGERKGASGTIGADVFAWAGAAAVSAERAIIVFKAAFSARATLILALGGTLLKPGI
jgi:hypothetical protein